MTDLLQFQINSFEKDDIKNNFGFEFTISLNEFVIKVKLFKRIRVRSVGGVVSLLALLSVS